MLRQYHIAYSFRFVGLLETAYIIGISEGIKNTEQATNFGLMKLELDISQLRNQYIERRR